MPGRSGKQCRERYQLYDSGGITSSTQASTTRPGAKARSKFCLTTMIILGINGPGLHRICQVGLIMPSRIIFTLLSGNQYADSIDLSLKQNRRKNFGKLSH